MPLWLELLVLMPFLGVAIVLIVGHVAGTIWDYFDYQRGLIGWRLLPAPAKRVWRWRHPNEPIVEYRRDGNG